MSAPDPAAVERLVQAAVDQGLPRKVTNPEALAAIAVLMAADAPQPMRRAS